MEVTYRIKKPLLMLFIASTFTAGLNLASVATAHADSISMTKERIMVNGNTYSQPEGFVFSGTTYMPLWYVMQALKSVGLQNTWNGKQWDIAYPGLGGISPLNQGTDPTTITVNGSTYAGFQAIVAIDPASGKDTTYIPVWYIMQVLKALNIPNTWDGQTWSLGQLTWGVVQ